METSNSEPTLGPGGCVRSARSDDDDVGAFGTGRRRPAALGADGEQRRVEGRTFLATGPTAEMMKKPSLLRIWVSLNGETMFAS